MLEVNPPNTSEPPRFERETVRPRARDRRPSRGPEVGAGRDRERTPPQPGTGGNKPLILSILYIASIAVGLTGLVAFILAFVWKSEPHEPWEGSHYDYHIRTFLLWFGTTVVAIILVFTLIGAIIGIPLLLLAMILVLVRGIVSLARASRREPMPNPGTWLA